MKTMSSICESGISADTVLSMPYVDFISLLAETNRCPGGVDTLRRIALNAFIGPTSSVLEIGSNTGFSSLETAKIVHCKVVGIDPVPAAVQQSNAALACEPEEIRDLVTFQVGSAYSLDFEDESFDLLITGGATSFMNDKAKAVSEYYRVLKNYGFLSVAHLYYREPPPKRLIRELSQIIGVEIPIWGKKEWDTLFSMDGLFEKFWEFDNRTQTRTDGEIMEYVGFFLEKPHISLLPRDVREAIKKRWFETLSVFNENQKYTGYSIRLFRKILLKSEPELFPSEMCDKDGNYAE